ncbi:hypothetical protein KIL84_002610 [Mauremys mutica]|uniref:Uncharacterized protein n=1 Tax=Mauremys mutica TaxID=74926 RepID=A0A9D4AZE4_9SAUR|nr:hypothetical protein KIL84_002610 [Mauremys mutica]
MHSCTSRSLCRRLGFSLPARELPSPLHPCSRAARISPDLSYSFSTQKKQPPTTAAAAPRTGKQLLKCDLGSGSGIAERGTHPAALTPPTCPVTSVADLGGICIPGSNPGA